MYPQWSRSLLGCSHMLMPLRALEVGRVWLPKFSQIVYTHRGFATPFRAKSGVRAGANSHPIRSKMAPSSGLTPPPAPAEKVSEGGFECGEGGFTCSGVRRCHAADLELLCCPEDIQSPLAPKCAKRIARRLEDHNFTAFEGMMDTVFVGGRGLSEFTGTNMARRMHLRAFCSFMLMCTILRYIFGGSFRNT